MEAEPLEVEVMQASSPPVAAVQSQAAVPEAIPRQKPKVGAMKSLSRYCFFIYSPFEGCFHWILK